MFSDISFTSIEGARKDRSITVYALSTCGFCKRALSFLSANSFAYKYVYVDLLPMDRKADLKKALAAKFGAEVSFPYAVIDDKEVLVGFIEPDWKKTLGADA
jgi:glutaredoxin-like protein NrdH